MVGGDGERVGEYQWRARKVAAGVVGHEEGRRRGLGGELGGGGANGCGSGSGRHGEGSVGRSEQG